MEVMKNVLSTVWKISSGLTVNEVGPRLYVFQFQSNVEKERVLIKQPWYFNKSLLVIAPFDEKSKPEEFNLQWCCFWIQIHVLPLRMMTEKIRVVLGETMGDVEEVEAEGNQMAW